MAPFLRSIVCDCNYIYIATLCRWANGGAAKTAFDGFGIRPADITRTQGRAATGAMAGQAVQLSSLRIGQSGLRKGMPKFFSESICCWGHAAFGKFVHQVFIQCSGLLVKFVLQKQRHCRPSLHQRGLIPAAGKGNCSLRMQIGGPLGLVRRLKHLCQLGKDGRRLCGLVIFQVEIGFFEPALFRGL